MIGPTPNKITSIVISITKNGVKIRSNTFGIIFLNFFSNVAPNHPVTIAVNTLPWHPTNGIKPNAIIASTPLLGSATA